MDPLIAVLACVSVACGALPLLALLLDARDQLRARERLQRWTPRGER